MDSRWGACCRSASSGWSGRSSSSIISVRCDFAAGHPAQRRRAAASAHRAVDGHLPVRRRDHASRQRRLRAADPAGRGQLDDGGSRNHPFRALRASTRGRRHDARHPGVGRAAAASTRKPSPRSRITPRRTCPRSRVAGVGAADRRQRVRRACARQDPLADVLRALATAAGREGAIAGRVSRARGVRRRRHRRRRRAAVRDRPDDRVHARRARLFTAATAATIMLLGGEPIGERFIEWNFVSSSLERIEQAKADWRAGRMKLPDLDNQEFIPLPGGPPPPAPAMSLARFAARVGSPATRRALSTVSGPRARPSISRRARGCSSAAGGRTRTVPQRRCRACRATTASPDPAARGRTRTTTPMARADRAC